MVYTVITTFVSKTDLLVHPVPQPYRLITLLYWRCFQTWPQDCI